MAARRRGGPRGTLGPKERRRLGQLAVCLAVFLAVFFGKGLLPDRVAALREVLTADTDVSAAFAQLGASLEPGGSVTQTLARFWGQEESPSPVPTATPTATPTPTATAAPVPTPTATATPASTPEPVPTPEPTPDPTPEPTPTPVPSSSGREPPSRATLDYDALGLVQTMAPVSGGCTSPYGWRDYPLGEGQDFHYGVDLSAAEGTPISAFADGVVDYIGEGPSYGKYIQLRHSDSVTTFYAHCSKLLLRKGDKVAMGDTIALTGATGDVTGPHLHFELRIDRVYHDPAYYLDLP